MAHTVSKMVAAREEVVGSSIEIHSPLIIESLGKELFPDGVPGDVNLSKLVESLGNALRRRSIEMHDADVALAAEIADDQEKRDARDACLAALRLEVQDSRDAINGTYGGDLAEAYGYRGEVPTRGGVLRNYASAIVKLLRETPFTAEPKRGRGRMDAEELAATLQQLLDDSIAAVGEVAQEEREYQVALKTRDEAVTEWARSYRGVADVTSALFVIAGEEALAERVRPTVRKSAGIVDPETLEETTDGAPSEGTPEGGPADG